MLYFSFNSDYRVANYCSFDNIIISAFDIINFRTTFLSFIAAEGN